MYDHILVLDTETASLEKGVCEIAYYLVDMNFTLISKHRALINPEIPICPGASGVHKIEDDDVFDCPTLGEYLGDQFKDKNVLMVGHNISFDVGHVKEHFGSIEEFCTLRLAWYQYPEAVNHKLQTLMYELKLTKGNSHSALDDVHTCFEMVHKVMDETGYTFQELINILEKPIYIHKMAFGKHRGELMKDVPKGYLRWLSKQPDLEEDLAYTVDFILSS
jgi:exodeoxyribonuclease X